MTPAKQRRIADQLEREYLRSVERAFLAEFRAMGAAVNAADLQRAIASGDVARVIALMNVEPSALRDFERRVATVFEESGRRFMASLPRNVRDPRGLLVQFRFDVRHPQAEGWLRREAAGLVTRIVDAQREAIRAALGEMLRDGLSPRAAALRLVGRINRATGRREGGIIGLSRPQSQYLANARRYLETFDPQYFNMTLRDRRFDAAIRRAFEARQALPATTRERVLTQYSNRLLRARGEAVARTETLNALRAGKHQAFAQGAEQAGVDDRFVTREWDATRDSDTRETHTAADGQKIQGSDATFIVGGYPMKYPGDASNGAPAEEVIHCRCAEVTRIDFIGAERARRGG